MSSLWDRLTVAEGQARLRGTGERKVEDVVSCLEAGDLPESLGLAPADLLAVLAFEALGGPGSPGPSLVQRPPRRPRLEKVLREEALSKLLPGSSRPARLSLAAALLQIHDFWDSSHEAAQAADDLGENRFSAYWHGIAHRREPDPGNASYWFRRVGRHEIFGALAQSARPIFEDRGDDRWASRLIGQGGWNPSAMIDLCTGALAGSPDETLARSLQRLEMQILMDHTARSVWPEA